MRWVSGVDFRGPCHTFLLNLLHASCGSSRDGWETLFLLCNAAPRWVLLLLLLLLTLQTWREHSNAMPCQCNAMQCWFWTFALGGWVGGWGAGGCPPTTPDMLCSFSPNCKWTQCKISQGLNPAMHSWHGAAREGKLRDGDVVFMCVRVCL